MEATTPEAPAASFDDWDPAQYLRDYYTDVEPDEVETIRFLVEAARAAPAGPALCFGTGPTLRHVFLAAPRCTELLVADLLPGNLAEVERWRQGAPGAHDWTPFVRYTLRCEGGGAEPSAEEIAAREELTRRRLSGLVLADAGRSDPLGAERRGSFSLVLSPFCADSATDERITWFRYMRTIASLVAPGGLLLTAALWKCRRYRVGHRYFPSADVDVCDLRAVLGLDFLPESVCVESRHLPAHERQGYSGILLARATRGR